MGGGRLQRGPLGPDSCIPRPPRLQRHPGYGGPSPGFDLPRFPDRHGLLPSPPRPNRWEAHSQPRGFGPTWWRKQVRGRAAGSWVLLFLWTVSASFLIGSVVLTAIRGRRKTWRISILKPRLKMAALGQRRAYRAEPLLSPRSTGPGPELTAWATTMISHAGTMPHPPNRSVHLKSLSWQAWTANPEVSSSFSRSSS